MSGTDHAIERHEADASERRALFAVYRSPGGAGGAVDAADVRDRARVELGSDGTPLATNAGFTPEAVETAAARGIDLVGPDDLARLVEALDGSEGNDLRTRNGRNPSV